MESKRTLYNIEQIMKMLPHRFPFLLVDRVEEIEVPDASTRIGRKAKAIKNITANEPYFPGHFPAKPVMPGVLQIECMAQVAALSCMDPNDHRPVDLFIVGINEARFRRLVVPGDQLVVRTEVLKDRNHILVVKCDVQVDGQIVAEAEIMAKFYAH